MLQIITTYEVDIMPISSFVLLKVILTTRYFILCPHLVKLTYASSINQDEIVRKPLRCIT